ncbi:MAG TPA: hypothetical protein VGA30_03480 [Actinomycetota bacterium]
MQAGLASRSTVDRYVPPAVAVVVGAALGGGTRAGSLVLGAALAAITFVVPMGWLASLSLGAALGFRLLAPSSSGPLSVVPDALIALVALRAGALVALQGAPNLPPLVRRAGALVALLALLALASAVVNHDSARALVGSLRQFVRFPLWALALLIAGLTWKDGRLLLRVLLAGSLLQLPFAVAQFGLHGAGDGVVGTFGAGGSGVMMVFLVAMAAVWFALAMERAIPWWTLWAIGPTVILPMALGSAAMFVVFLPLAVFLLMVRATMLGRGPRPGVLAGLLVILAVAGWGARSFAVAPPCAGCASTAATSIYSNRYLAQYYDESLRQGPNSRLGFLVFAARADAQTGPSGMLFGQGPGQSFVGAGATPDAKLSLSRFPALRTRSLQSVQRVVLGLGFPALGLIILLIGLPGWASMRPLSSSDPLARAVTLAMPVVAAIILLTGPYTASWSDPGVVAAYWALALVAQTARDTGRAPMEGA